MLFDDVEKAFLAAAMDPTLWPDAMDCVARQAHATGAVLLPLSGPIFSAGQSSSLDELVAAYFRDGWDLRDERYKSLPKIKTNGIVVDFDHTNVDDMERSAYYQELLRPHGFKWYAGVGVKTPDMAFSLAIQRRAGELPFDQAEQEKLGQWGKKLSAAAIFASQLVEARRKGAFDLFEHLDAPALLLDRNGLVLRKNRDFDRVLCPELSIKLGILSVAHKEAAKQVRRAIEATMAGGGGQKSAGPILIPRETKRPLLLYVVNVDGVENNPFFAARAIAFVRDPDTVDTPRAELVARVLGLTPREGQLSALLAEGKSLELAAEEMLLVKETSRTMLKSIFAKTDTRRQGALIALISRIVRRL